MTQDISFSEEQKTDWQKAQELLKHHPCKCGVCAANIYLKIRAEKAMSKCLVSRKPAETTEQQEENR